MSKDSFQVETGEEAVITGNLEVIDQYSWIIDTVAHESREYKFGIAVGKLFELSSDATVAEKNAVAYAFDDAMTSAMREVLERQDEDPMGAK